MFISNDMLTLMKEFTQEIGISGNENRISNLLKKYYKNYCDDIIYDNLGSIFAIKKSKSKNAKKVMICAHMDEIGFLVNEIKDDGLLKVISIGNISNQILLGKRVDILTSSNEKIKGVVLTKKIQKNDLKLDDIFIDIGATSKKEVIDVGVKLGDSAVLSGEFDVLLDKRLASKAWDNRYGCILGVEILKELKDYKFDFDLYIGATVQNEVGLRGSITSTNLVKPDMCIVLDCLASNDIDNNTSNTGKLGEGVLASFYDKSMIPNRALLDYFIDICESNNIKYQHYYSMDDSDAGWIHKLLEGCPTLKVCICARNIKTNSTIIDFDDYINSKKSIIELIKLLSVNDIEFFKTHNR